MMEKLTILISSAHKKFINRRACQQNKSVSGFIDDLFASIQRESSRTPEKDGWLEQVAGSYATGKKDILAEQF